MSKRVTPKQKEKHYKSALREWFICEALFPIIFIASAWPLASYFAKLNYAFERVFSSADLIPVACIIMLGVNREITTEIKLNRVKGDFEWPLTICTYLPYLFLMAYTSLKSFYLSYTFPESGEVTSNLDDVIIASSYFAFASMAFATGYSFMIRKLLIKNLK